MNIDLLGGMPPLQAIDIKTEKNADREDTRPIEESGKSNDLGLNIDKEAIAEKLPVKDAIKEVEIEPETYNVRGDLSQNSVSSDAASNEQEPIHLVV